MSGVIRQVFSVAAVVVGLVAGPASSEREPTPLTLEQVEWLVKNGVDPVRIRANARERCLGFLLDDSSRDRLKKAGANAEHFANLEGLCVRLPRIVEVTGWPGGDDSDVADNEEGDVASPRPSAKVKPRAPLTLFVGGGYMLGTGLDEGTVPQGPMAELGVLYGTNPRIGGRLCYQQLLSEQEQPWGAVSLDVILGGGLGLLSLWRNASVGAGRCRE